MSLSPTNKKKVRDTIPIYCEASFENAWNISYSQQRPFHYYNHMGAGHIVLDCSGYVGNVFWNAMHDTGIYLHDPLNYRYTGYGWTGSEEAWLREAGKRVTEANGFLIGDIARWGEGNHSHTGVCYKAGSGSTSRWASHGSEAGPLSVQLHYRPDLVGVWRTPALL